MIYNFLLLGLLFLSTFDVLLTNQSKKTEKDKLFPKIFNHSLMEVLYQILSLKVVTISLCKPMEWLETS